MDDTATQINIRDGCHVLKQHYHNGPQVKGNLGKKSVRLRFKRHGDAIFIHVSHRLDAIDRHINVTDCRQRRRRNNRHNNKHLSLHLLGASKGERAVLRREKGGTCMHANGNA